MARCHIRLLTRGGGGIIPTVVSTGLVAYVDFTQPTCYSGTGTTFYNLVDNVAQTITVDSVSSVSYTSAKGLRLNNKNVNYLNPGACLSLTTYAVQTISVWYKIYSTGYTQYICDARTNPPTGTSTDLTGYAYSGNPNFGPAWDKVYMNGGSAQNAQTASWSGTINPTTPTTWMNVTIVGLNPSVTYPTIAGRYNKVECLDSSIAFVLVYNRAITQTENTTNYNAFLSKMNALT